ncbi:relaxase/mobilization nuclease domain-containing protein [Pseudotenacibaculum haliotis]|uniref:Relaxase/mobilization nuclease domain-containing protein n=1 Tax=Pseudotenacibaculum haliotis TaxID=1862138 RepID=A0ABW5LR91_9FLAO
MKKLLDYCFAPEKTMDKQCGREAVLVKRHIRGYDTKRWVDAFKRNDENRSFTHKNRVVLRHEIVAFSPEDNHKITVDMLEEIGAWYLRNRSESIGVCAVHWEESIHLHFVIAGVGLDGKSTRISRGNFKAFKIRLQEYQKQRFPELSHSIVEHSKKKPSRFALRRKKSI